MSGTARLRLPLVIGLGGILALGAAAPRQVKRVGGTFTMTYSQRNPQVLHDAEGHVLLSTSSTGANQSTGPTSYMPGAAVTNSELADLIQGNGSHEGYVTLSLSGAVYVVQWQGAVTTVPGPDHQPVTTFKGAWTNVRGPSGHGTYTGRITGPDTYTVDWEGEIAN
ncbi:MAG TPA: hypothetical protein VNH46_08040 [Gemmatimonadales bacterium]|nr:hypothetical protein [Gemmatimonadales bacterium]